MQAPIFASLLGVPLSQTMGTNTIIIINNNIVIIVMIQTPIFARLLSPLEPKDGVQILLLLY